MGQVLGFTKYKRTDKEYRDKEERLGDWRDVAITRPLEELREQGARCMDCGTPFCHNLGCPLGNSIPDWNDAVYKGQWREAYERLERTSNFPEITGIICPALCEASCTLSINDAPVTIKQIELAIMDRAFREGWVVPRPPKHESGKSAAVIGSGPAGMSAAQQLRRMGHRVTLFEKSETPGGLLRYGIPDFKLEKFVLDRRFEQMRTEGIDFETGVSIGEDLSIRYLRNKFDAVLIAAGAGTARDLPVPGRDLDGIHFAMEYLSQANRNVSAEPFQEELISAKAKTVLVIGGGDTGSDCVGTAARQGARKVYQYEILSKPINWTKPWNPSWPEWPNILRTTSSHYEGCERDWCIATDAFTGENGKVKQGDFHRIEWKQDPGGGRPSMVKTPDEGFKLDVDLVLLAMGFVHPEHGRIITDLNIKLDDRGNIAADKNYQTSVEGVFTAGDANTGASLVVRAMDHGRRAATAIHRYLIRKA